jgi:hypothetical protein
MPAVSSPVAVKAGDADEHDAEGLPKRCVGAGRDDPLVTQHAGEPGGEQYLEEHQPQSDDGIKGHLALLFCEPASGRPPEAGGGGGGGGGGAAGRRFAAAAAPRDTVLTVPRAS